MKQFKLFIFAVSSLLMLISHNIFAATSAEDCSLTSFQSSDTAKKLVTKTDQSGMMILDSKGDYEDMHSQLQDYADKNHCKLYLFSEKQMMQATLKNKHVSESDKKQIRKDMSKAINYYALYSAVGIAMLNMVTDVKIITITPNK